MSITRKFAVLGLAATVGLAACGESTGPLTQDSPLLNLDVAHAMADGAGEDVATMRELSHGLQVGMRFWLGPSDAPGQARDCPYNAGTGWHVCETVSLPNGLTIDRSYAFYDAANAPMETFDQLLTAKIRFQKSVDGAVTRTGEGGSMSAEVSHDRDMTVTGLAGEETSRTWNGTGHSEVKRTRISDAQGTRSYELTAAVTVANVVVPRRTDQNVDAWPTSGTITKVVTGTVTDGTNTREVSRTVVITFNGTQFPTATVNGESFEIDLGARRARRADRRNG